MRHELSGYWSRRVTDEHRLVYRVYTDATDVVHCEIIQCLRHYNG